MVNSKFFTTISRLGRIFATFMVYKRKSIHYESAAGASMLAEREPSRPAHFEYCPAFEKPTVSCSTTLRVEALRRTTGKGRIFANDQAHPPGIPSRQRAVSSVFLLPS